MPSCRRSTPARTRGPHAACDSLEAVAQPDGAVRTILPSALEAPRAAHWQIDNWAEDSPNPTAGIAGTLHALGVTHPWLDRATDWMWRRLDGRPFDEAHDLLGVTTFLSHVPDRPRAGAALANVMAQLPAAAYFLSEPSKAYGLTALTFAPTPEAPTRPYLDAAQIEAHLDALEADQQEDGGWPVAWTPPGDAAIWEWRGTRTLEALRTLRAWGALLSGNRCFDPVLFPAEHPTHPELHHDREKELNSGIQD